MQSNTPDSKSLFGFRDLHVSLHAANRALGLSHHTPAKFYLSKGLDIVRVGRTSYLRKKDVANLLDQSTTQGKPRNQPEPPPRRPNDPGLRFTLTSEEIQDRLILCPSSQLAEELAEIQAISGEDGPGGDCFERVQISSQGLQLLARGLENGLLSITAI